MPSVTNCHKKMQTVYFQQTLVKLKSLRHGKDFRNAPGQCFSPINTPPMSLASNKQLNQIQEREKKPTQTSAEDQRRL